MVTAIQEQVHVALTLEFPTSIAYLTPDCLRSGASSFSPVDDYR